jgi:hypothetical protein
LSYFRMKRPSARVAGLVTAVGATIGLTAAVPAAALAAAQPQSSTVASAAASSSSQRQLPTRCFAPVDVRHAVFGPDSFFLPPGVQGPTSFSENAGPTVVTFPRYNGVSGGKPVTYVITDASNLSVARALGVNYTPKLAKSEGTAAVQVSSSKISTGNGIVFPATVDFSPTHILTPSATGFPPTVAQAGAVGEPGYSPFVQARFQGQTVVLDAPQIANASGQADRVVSITPQTVNYRETDGCYDNESVHYASFDSSDPTAAAIEDATYTPNLNAVPSAGCADASVVSTTCGRESLIAFTNGQTGLNNPQRQGLNATTFDGFSALNILEEVPEPNAQFDYSPAWDIHLATWTSAAVAAGINVRQTDFSAALQQVADGNVTGFPAGTQFGPSGFVNNCPVISLDVNLDQ